MTANHTTAHPTTAALLAECAALLPALQWATHESARTHGLRCVAARVDGGAQIVAQVPGTTAGYLVVISHDPPGAGWLAPVTAEGRAQTLREAYTIARDRYDLACVVARPGLPEVVA
jgi:hypothetical protein